ncbi:site-specific integrase [Ferrovibrio terrae]|uniref:Site-specific integrase n=1 Tax=Ferrovibrio terrae TaxID=2594003 RepID=A0A516GYK2_9PROT|nr:site-specific integrase [Ferrovibrio terrae]QDO96420.1 site-specific integrase [Ferrovibrio terrae]
MASITKRGSTYLVRVRRKGYPTVTKSFRTKAEAEKFQLVIESEMSRAVYVDRSEAERTTLHDALERYLAEVIPVKKGHQEAYRIKALMAEPLARMSLAELGSKHFASYRDAELRRVSAKTVRLSLGTISHVYTILIKEWGFGGLTNPIQQIRKPKMSAARDRRLDPGEEGRLLQACDEGRNAWLRPLVELAIETAMRRGELTGMRWQDIDLAKQVVLLRDVKHPTLKISRRVPLSSRAVEILRSLPRCLNGRVFPITGDGVTQAFERACLRADIVGLTFHDLRHEATSRFFERGFDMMKVSAITGHQTLQMLKRYTQLRPEDIAKELG